MTPEQEMRLARVEDLLSNFTKSDRYIFQRDIQMLDGRNVQFATGTGTKLGTASGQKFSLWGVTPVDQPETVASPEVNTVTDIGNTTNNGIINNNFAALDTAVEAIIDRLQEVGIIK